MQNTLFLLVQGLALRKPSYTQAIHKSSVPQQAMASPLITLTPRFIARMSLEDLTKKPQSSQDLEFFEGKVMPTPPQLNSKQKTVSADDPANKLSSTQALSRQSLKACSALLMQASLKTAIATALLSPALGPIKTLAAGSLRWVNPIKTAKSLWPLVGFTANMPALISRLGLQKNEKILLLGILKHLIVYKTELNLLILTGSVAPQSTLSSLLLSRLCHLAKETHLYWFNEKAKPSDPQKVLLETGLQGFVSAALDFGFCPYIPNLLDNKALNFLLCITLRILSRAAYLRVTKDGIRSADMITRRLMQSTTS